MKFKIKRVLNDHQLVRAKVSLVIASLLCIGFFGGAYLGQVEAQDDGPFMYNDEEYKLTEVAEFERGRIVYYSNNEEVCNR